LVLDRVVRLKKLASKIQFDLFLAEVRDNYLGKNQGLPFQR
jgi:hypothetical protein